MRTSGEKMRISDEAERVQSVLYSHKTSLVGLYAAETVACRWGANGETAPGIQGKGSIRRVKLQKLECCNQTIFPIVKLLTHTACAWASEEIFSREGPIVEFPGVVKRILQGGRKSDKIPF